MEILTIYEIKNQLLCDPQDPSHAKNWKSAHFSQGVELINHRRMMVYTNCEYGSIITHVNMSVLWEMDPTMEKQLGRDELDDKSDYSGDDRYHLVEISDDDTYIRYGDTYIRIQAPLKSRNKQNVIKLSKLCMISLKQVTSTFLDPTSNANNFGKM